MTREHVTVILPYYNREDTLTEAAMSVLDQTHHALTLCMVNDGSTDGSSEVARAIVDDRIEHVELVENHGHCVARNAGLDRAGRLVAFMDSDDLWMPNKLELQLAYLRREQSRDPLVALVGGGWQILGHASATRSFATGPFKYADALKGIAGTGTPLLLVDRRATGDVRFDPSLLVFEDRDFVISCLAVGAKAVVVPDIVALIRRGRSDHAANPGQAAEAWERMLKKYGAELAGDVKLWSHYKFRTAREHLVNRDVGAAIPHIAGALGDQRLRRSIHLAFGALGRSRGLAAAQKLMPLE